MITREKFVKICDQAIIDTRKNVVIVNQKNGYLLFHNEIKNMKYMSKVLRRLTKSVDRTALQYRHDIIKYAGVGRCSEIAY